MVSRHPHPDGGSAPGRAGHPVYITGEIGINHNGELGNALALIDQAADAGCDAVKFQKRTPEICTPRDQWDIERDTPWGRMTYIDYRHRVEFGVEEYPAIDEHAKRRGIDWFASPWDVESVDFLEEFHAAGAQGRFRLPHRRRAAAATARHWPDDHPLDRHVHHAPDPARR